MIERSADGKQKITVINIGAIITIAPILSFIDKKESD